MSTEKIKNCNSTHHTKNTLGIQKLQFTTTLQALIEQTLITYYLKSRQCACMKWQVKIHVKLQNIKFQENA
jgi:hypothetical protein